MSIWPQHIVTFLTPRADVQTLGYRPKATELFIILMNGYRDISKMLKEDCKSSYTDLHYPMRMCTPYNR